MPKKFICFLVLLLVVQTSCKQSTNSDNNSIVVEKNEEQYTEINLNNGLKWEANPETTLGIENMIRIVKEFKVTEDLERYLALKGSLQSEFKTIFDKCTMTGEAHDQLHNFLLPLMDMFGGLKSDKSQERKETVSKIKKHLHIYNDYFK